MTNRTPQKLRSVRCIATGKITSQSSNKTKRLLKLGGYVEIFPGRSEAQPIPAHGRAPVRRWRAIGIGASVILAGLAMLVLLT